MKRKTVLKKQAVEKKHRSRFSEILRTARRIGSGFFKASFLVVALIAISFLFVSLYGYLLTSPYIRLDQVVVRGVDEPLREELLQMAKLSSEVSLLAIDLHELQKVLEKHPWIRSVELEKHFPHTLLIRAEKEEPWAVVAMDKLFYMNRWGKIFKELNRGDEADFPVVTGIPENAEDREKSVKVALEVLRIFEAQGDSWSLKNLSELHVKGDGEVILYFSHLPASIRIRGSSLAARLEDLKKIVEHLQSSGRFPMVKGINLNYDEGAVVAFKKG